ncbi:MAG: hypothetical protein ACP5N2_05140 [Candidatus Nanoarchaeia archaeon]
MSLKNGLRNIGIDLVVALYNWGIRHSAYDGDKHEHYKQGLYAQVKNSEFIEKMKTQFESWKKSGIDKRAVWPEIKAHRLMDHSSGELFIYQAKESGSNSYSDLVKFLDSERDDYKTQLEELASGASPKIDQKDEFPGLPVKEFTKKELTRFYKHSEQYAYTLRQYLLNNNISF